MSTDHTWSARVIVFVPGEVLVEQGESVQAQLTARLPDHFDGFHRGQRDYGAALLPGQLGLDVSVVWDAYDWVSLPSNVPCHDDGSGVPR
jgi:hypothetical protein